MSLCFWIQFGWYVVYVVVILAFASFNLLTHALNIFYENFCFLLLQFHSRDNVHILLAVSTRTTNAKIFMVEKVLDYHANRKLWPLLSHRTHIDNNKYMYLSMIFVVDIKNKNRSILAYNRCDIHEYAVSMATSMLIWIERSIVGHILIESWWYYIRSVSQSK